MMVGAIATVMVWFGLELTGAVYDAFPAMVMGFLIYIIGDRIGGHRLRIQHEAHHDDARHRNICPPESTPCMCEVVKGSTN